MQKDMHFYGVYTLCRAVGINSQNAHTIAYASQFVDDAVKEKNLIFRKSQKALRAVMTSHKPLDYQNASYGDQWRVWTSFHFLPGNESKNGKFEEKMICTPDSELANIVLKNAEDNLSQSYGLYLVGIASHAFADTFAHFGFIGINTEWNKVRESTIKVNAKRTSIVDYLNNELTKIISKASKIIPVGHGSVGTHPDQPYLVWEYEYEKGRRPKVQRDNFTFFNNAAYLLFKFYKRILEINPRLGDPNNSKDFADIKDEVKIMLKKQANTENRIKAWKGAIRGGKFFSPDVSDKKIHYYENLWQISDGELKLLDEDQILELPLYKFQQAALNQMNVVDNFLIENEIVF